jgi:hypothetical protein
MEWEDDFDKVLHLLFFIIADHQQKEREKMTERKREDDREKERN